jgi:hypothetical protein
MSPLAKPNGKPRTWALDVRTFFIQALIFVHLHGVINSTERKLAENHD